MTQVYYHFTRLPPTLGSILHASKHPFTELQYGCGPLLYIVELEDVTQGGGRFIGLCHTIIASIDASSLLREFARWCALQVIDKWPVSDVVREYLETGNDELREEARGMAWASQQAIRAAGEASVASINMASVAAWTMKAAEAAGASQESQKMKLQGMFYDAWANS